MIEEVVLREEKLKKPEQEQMMENPHQLQSSLILIFERKKGLFVFVFVKNKTLWHPILNEIVMIWQTMIWVRTTPFLFPLPSSSFCHGFWVVVTFKSLNSFGLILFLRSQTEKSRCQG